MKISFARANRTLLAMNDTLIGYARCSTDKQDLTAQQAQTVWVPGQRQGMRYCEIERTPRRPSSRAQMSSTIPAAAASAGCPVSGRLAGPDSGFPFRELDGQRLAKLSTSEVLCTDVRSPVHTASAGAAG